MLALVLMWLCVCQISVAAPEPKRVPESSPTIESNANNQSEKSQGTTEQSPLHVRIVQSQDDAASTNARERDSDERQREDLKAQKRSADAAEKQVVLGRWAVGLSIAGFLGLLVTLWLTNRSVREAARAAEAANANTASLMSAERAYVKMEHVPPGLLFDKPGGDLKMVLTNHGRTPATITDVRIGLKRLDHGEPLQEPFTYRERVKYRQAYLVPNETFTFTEVAFLGASVKDDSSRRLWAFGHVDYEDAFGNQYRRGWARLYEPALNGGPNNLVYSEEFSTPYNYDRKRTKDHGNDQ